MLTQEHNKTLAVRIIREGPDWDFMESQWRVLFSTSPYAATSLRYAWLRHWWRHYGPFYGTEGHGLKLITMWRGSDLIGLMPLYENTVRCSLVPVHRLSFMSTGEAEIEETCADYLNLLCAPGEQTACLSLLRKAVQSLEWDVLELLDVPEGSPLLQENTWWEEKLEIVQRGSCPIADLRGGFEEYLQRFNSKKRKNAKRVLRAAAESGAVMELATSATTEEFFADFVRLHQDRWKAEGKPGCFSAPRFMAFHRTLLHELVPLGTAVLARLRVRGQTVAAIYGFITAHKFDVYQTGRTMATDALLPSPGIAAHLMLMPLLIERGVTHYDFLRGSCQYKDSMATEQRQLFGIRAFRPTMRALAYRSMRFLGRRIREEIASQPENGSEASA